MAEFNRERLDEILKDRNFEALKGEFENQWFECKKELAPLESQQQKAEFGKDVSSLANLDGGILILGVKAGKPEGDSETPHASDVVKSIHLIRADLVDPDKIKKVLNEWIYPPVGGLEVEWLDGPNNGEGLVAIRVPAQSEELKPFLYFFVNDNDTKKAVLFGYSVRGGGTSEPTKIHRLHAILQKGLNYQNEMATRFDALEAQIGASKAAPAEKFEDLEEKHGERLKKNLAELGISSERVLILSAFVEPSAASTTFAKPQEIADSLRPLPEGLRDGGWSLIYSTDFDASPNVIRTKWSDSRSLELFADGTLIAFFDMRYLVFLRDESKPRIIPIALVEVVYQFVHFYFEFLRKLVLSGGKLFIRVDLINMHKDEANTMLQPGTAMPNVFAEPRITKNNDDFKTIEIRSRDHRVVTVEVLKIIYGFFGMTIDQIPYTELAEGTHVINLEPFSRSEPL